MWGKSRSDKWPILKYLSIPLVKAVYKHIFTRQRDKKLK